MPEGHVYVRHLSAPDGSDQVRRLADPRPCAAPSDQSVWWPPVMLDPDWVRRNSDAFDVFHIHFGFDAENVDRLRALVDALRRHGKPFVFTVHDLRNPHHTDPRAHEEHLDVLIPAADRLVTLTDGAAEVIGRRWGRTADVIPHPHIVGPETMRSPRRVRAEFVVGIHLKSLRANMDPIPVLAAAADAVARLPGAVLRVDVHPDVLQPGFPRYDADLVSYLRDAGRQRHLHTRVHDFFPDDELWAYLKDDIDVSVLPYRFGTHSGWLEACHDLGTIVVAPSCGFYGQQQPCIEYRHDDAGLDAESLASALRRAYHDRPAWRALPKRREAQRYRIAAAHRTVYERALG